LPQRRATSLKIKPRRLTAVHPVAAQEFSEHYIRHVDIGVQEPDARS
jgi:hypothetical protein